MIKYFELKKTKSKMEPCHVQWSRGKKICDEIIKEFFHSPIVVLIDRLTAVFPMTGALS